MKQQSTSVASQEASSRHDFAVFTVLLIIVLALLEFSTLTNEARIIVGDYPGLASAPPVPQASYRDPRIDRAFRVATSRIPAGMACVVSVDMWNEDYFRASYVMMPRRIWPYSNQKQTQAAAPSQLAAALKRYGSSCLLLGDGLPVPPGFERRSSGSYSLFVATRAG